MTRAAESRRSDRPLDGLAQDEADAKSLEVLAEQRGYLVWRNDSHTWLEWSRELTEPPNGPEAAWVLRWFAPFEPFVYPKLDMRRGDRPTPSVQEPTFLEFRPTVERDQLRGMQGRAAEHVRSLAGRLQLDDDRRAAPEALGWLVTYRDALALDFRRCAARLEASSDGLFGDRSPMSGARDTLKVWLVEAGAALGETAAAVGVSQQPELARAGAIAVMAWNRFKSGEDWGGEQGDNEWLTTARHVATLEIPRLPRSVVVATVAGLRHHARVRDGITAPAFDIWPRLLAAETVLHAALAGTPLDDDWIEDAVRHQREEDARHAREADAAEEEEAEKARLRKIFLSDATRLPYILETYHPIASANPITGSVWRDTLTLFVEAWIWAGLPEDNCPHTKDKDGVERKDGVALKNAVTARRARLKKAEAKKEGRIGYE